MGAEGTRRSTRGYRGHNYVGHNYTGHNYKGHNYRGHKVHAVPLAAREVPARHADAADPGQGQDEAAAEGQRDRPQEGRRLSLKRRRAPKPQRKKASAEGAITNMP